MVTKICQITQIASGKHREYMVNLTTREYNDRYTAQQKAAIFLSAQHVLPTYAIWAVQKLENLILTSD